LLRPGDQIFFEEANAIIAIGIDPLNKINPEHIVLDGIDKSDMGDDAETCPIVKGSATEAVELLNQFVNVSPRSAVQVYSTAQSGPQLVPETPITTNRVHKMTFLDDSGIQLNDKCIDPRKLSSYKTAETRSDAADVDTTVDSHTDVGSEYAADEDHIEQETPSRSEYNRSTHVCKKAVEDSPYNRQVLDCPRDNMTYPAKVDMPDNVRNASTDPSSMREAVGNDLCNDIIDNEDDLDNVIVTENAIVTNNLRQTCLSTVTSSLKGMSDNTPNIQSKSSQTFEGLVQDTPGSIAEFRLSVVEKDEARLTSSASETLDQGHTDWLTTSINDKPRPKTSKVYKTRRNKRQLRGTRDETMENSTSDESPPNKRQARSGGSASKLHNQGLCSPNGLILRSSQDLSSRMATPVAPVSGDGTMATKYEGSKPFVLFSSGSTTKNNHKRRKFLEANTKVVDEVPNKGKVFVCIGSEFKATAKVLLALVRGHEVVSDGWINESVKAGYLLKAEGFRPQGLYNGRFMDRSRLFEGRTVFLTKTVEKSYGKSYDDVVKILVNASARKVQAVAARDVNGSEDAIIIGQEYGDNDVLSLLSKDYDCYKKEIISSSILAGHLLLDVEEYRLMK